MRILCAATNRNLHKKIENILGRIDHEDVYFARSFAEIENNLAGGKGEGQRFDLLILSGEYFQDEEGNRVSALEKLSWSYSYLLVLISEHDEPAEELSAFIESVCADDFQILPCGEQELEARIRIARRHIDHNQHLSLENSFWKDRENFINAVEREWERAYRSSQPISMVLLKAAADFSGSQEDDFENGEERGEFTRHIAKTIDDAIFRPADRSGVLKEGIFAVLLPETELSGARTVAKRLKRLVEITSQELSFIEGIDLNIGLTGAVPSMRYEGYKLIGVAMEALEKASMSSDENFKVITASELESNLRLE